MTHPLPKPYSPRTLALRKGFTATGGRAPSGGPFMVQFRSGWVSGPFKREQLRWADEGSDWCVIGVQCASERAEAATWNATAGGY